MKLCQEAVFATAREKKWNLSIIIACHLTVYTTISSVLLEKIEMMTISGLDL